MRIPILNLAQNFSYDELRQILSSEEVAKYGNRGFVGVQCSQCRIQANIPVSYFWSLSWTCACETENPCNEDPGSWKSPWDTPGIGPSRELINLLLEEIGLQGRKC
jgi:hypothetical protein